MWLLKIGSFHKLLKALIFKFLNSTFSTSVKKVAHTVIYVNHLFYIIYIS